MTFKMNTTVSVAVLAAMFFANTAGACNKPNHSECGKGRQNQEHKQGKPAVTIAPKAEARASVKNKVSVNNKINTKSTSSASINDSGNSSSELNTGDLGSNNSQDMTYNEARQLLYVPMHGIDTPMIGVDAAGYEGHVAKSDFSFSDVTGCGYTTWTMQKHDTFLGAFGKVKGSVKWEDLNKLVVAYPDMQNVYAKTDKVFFVTNAKLLQGSEISEDNVVGLMTYDTELSKHFFVPSGYLNERARVDATQFGGNVVVKVGSYHNGHFRADADNKTLGAEISKLFNAAATGAGVSAGIGGADTMGSKLYTNGAVYAYIRLDKPEQWLAKGRYEMVIVGLKSALIHCKKMCYNNASLRKLFADAYLLSGDTQEAIKNYEQAKKDIALGHEPDGAKTANLAGSKLLLEAINYNESLAIRIQDGEAAQIEFAKANGLRVMPENTSELKK